jgi:hypothetical protein
MTIWNHKDEWRFSGRDFSVVVSRHEVAPDKISNTGIHRWCVYAYLYPKHPHFKNVEGSSIYQNATEVMPLHGGCSLIRFHKEAEAEINSIQVGCDYNHLHDDRFCDYETKEEAAEVFRDADELITWLTEREAK